MGEKRVRIVDGLKGYLVDVDSDGSLLFRRTWTLGSAADSVDVSGTITLGTSPMGQVSTYLQTTTLYSVTASIEPKYTSVATTVSGGVTLISGVASSTIRVLLGLLISKLTVDIAFFSGATTSTQHTGLMALPANGGFQAPFCPVGNWVCDSGSSLVLRVAGTATTIGGWLVYTQV